MALPSTYKQVEYLESTGTQAFKLGSSFSSSYKTVVDFQFTQLTGDQSPIGMRDSNYVRYYFNENQGQWMAATGSSNNSSKYGTVDTNRHTVTINQGTLIVDSTSYSIPNGSKTYSGGLPIFAYCLDTNNSFYAFAYCKMYSLKVYNGSTLIYDIIPSVRKSDNKPGMYDLVNNVFYTNQGTGEFLYPEENWKIKKFLLGTSQIRPTPTTPTYEYEYDFRSKSWSTVQSDGWTLAQGTSRTNINNSGIVCPTRGQGNSNRFWIYRSVDASNAKKVTIYLQTYVQAAGRGNLLYYKLAAANTPIDITPSMQVAYSGTTTSGYQGHTGQLWLPNNESLVSPTTIYTGTFLCEGEVDLANKTSKLTVNGSTILTGTVSDATVTSIRSGAFLHLQGGHDTGTMYAEKIGIKIEY